MANPSKGDHPAVHVLNPTATARYAEFGIDYIFQPDQTKSPGTWGFKLDAQGRRVMGPDKRCVLVKISDEKASNITVMPGGWYETQFASLATRQVLGFVGLEIIEKKADQLVKENDRLRKEAASVQKDKAQLAELAAALAELEGAAAPGTDIAKGVAGIKGRIAALLSPVTSAPSSKK